jgi:DNA-binding NtrC family response regulator
MRALYRQIDRAAPTEASVFITGESGTGKELVARALHRGSPRADEAFVVVNCAALPEALLESEFFGHEKGAFTGALAQHKGRFEIADGGTVFLDEIGEMPPALQAKLLRVLQEHEFERVGGTGPLRTDVRVIAATHRDVTTGIQQGTFREDLYYRLKVISLHVPALRQREEDILPLAQHFLRRFAKEFHREVSSFDDEARAWLLSYQWPGNVRELEHAIEQAVIMGSSNVVRAQDLRETVRTAADPSGPTTTRYHDALDETRREVILRALKQAGGVYTEAAKLLGIHPVHLHRLMRGMHLKSEIKRDS